MEARHLFIGSYTALMQGNGTGITVLAVGASGELLDIVGSHIMDSPSFLAASAERLFAVSEGAQGRVTSFRRHQEHLTQISTVATGGAEPCHVEHDVDGRLLLVANYRSGSLAVIPADENGSLGDARVAASPEGSGPVPDRQDRPHVHQSLASDMAGNRWLVADLGIDRILEYELASDGMPTLAGSCALPAGAGPRHLAWAYGTLLVSGELDSRLHILRRRAAELQHSGSVSTVDPASDVEPGAVSQPSHLVVTRDQRFAYLANRGRDTLAVFDLSALADGGMPELVQETSCGGVWPRHFALYAGRIYVANQGSDTIAVFDTDPASGTIGARLQTVHTGSPACLVFA